uniref:Immunoglobulin V-set domain-containing protein n=1 Tax=Naja naja TaxID=35670 RepID=A0A8C6V9P1_NAJNA
MGVSNVKTGCNLAIEVLGSAVTVTQTPSFISDLTGQNISFSCSMDDTSYRFYLYHQLPGKTELKLLAYLPTASKTIQDIPPELKDRLKGEGSKSVNPEKRHMRLDLLKLQASDTGLYLCAWPVRSLQAAVKEKMDTILFL